MSNATTTAEIIEQTGPLKATLTPTWERDERGLLKGVEYHYNADGSVNWRKMVKPEFLVVNKENFVRRKQEAPKTIEGVDDKDLLILLGGLKDLARLRGYTSVVHQPTVSSPTFCSVNTTIHWIGNYETNGNSVTFDSLADASTHNTSSFARFYLSAIAENRGFVRAVRNFLGINIVGQDEVGPVAEEEDVKSNGEPNKFLAGFLKKNNISFENFKNRMIQKQVEGAESWERLSDVPSEKALELVDIVQKILDAIKAKAAAK